jgi:hypothetical protein
VDSPADGRDPIERTLRVPRYAATAFARRSDNCWLKASVPVLSCAGHLDHGLLVLVENQRDRVQHLEEARVQVSAVGSERDVTGMLSVMLSPVRVTLTPVRSSSAVSFACYRSMYESRRPRQQERRGRRR